MLRKLSIVLVALALLVGVAPSHQTLAAGNPSLQLCVPSSAPVKAEATPAAPEQPSLSAVDAPVLYVVSTVSPITNLVFNIGGNRIKLHALIPEGADSHTFEPKPTDATFTSQADVIFINGLSLEVPTLKLAEANLKAGGEIVLLGDLTLSADNWVYDFSFPKEKGDPNPHLWVNPLLALNYAGIIRDTLSKRDAAGADYYAANYKLFEARIKILDQAICDAIATIPAKQRKLLTYHDSFAYFAPRYGMTVIGAIQPSDFSEPSAQEVASLIDQLKAEAVPAIFGSEVFPSKVIEQIGREAGVKFVDTLADDDLPNQTDNRLYHSYLQMMVNNTITMTTTLGGDPTLMKVVPTDNIPGTDAGIETSGQ